MVSILFRMNAGIAGDVNRAWGSFNVEAQPVDPANPPTLYGQPVKVDPTSQALQPVGAGDTAAAVYGFLVRPWPTQQTTGGISLPFGSVAPPTTGIVDVMTRGYMSVQLNGAAASVKNAPVYVRVATPGTGKPIGGIEAAADGANTITVPGCVFRGGADANGITEIKFGFVP